MKSQDLHGGACGFIAAYVTFGRLCRFIEKLPGVVFTERSHFFWSASDIRAEFSFNGHTFVVEPGADDDGIGVTPKDEGQHFAEIQQMKDHLGRIAAAE